MKILEITRDESHDLNNECPYGQGQYGVAKVGSAYCYECPYQIMEDKKRKKVLCSADEEEE